MITALWRVNPAARNRFGSFAEQVVRTDDYGWSGPASVLFFSTDGVVVPGSGYSRGRMVNGGTFGSSSRGSTV